MVAASAMLMLVQAAVAQESIHKLALQISDNDPQKMNTVLNVAANVSRHYTDMAEEIEIKIVAFNAGLHMLRSDTSPVAERMKSFAQSMPNVSFEACNNTLEAMEKKEGKDIALLDNVEIVPAGVVTLMELDADGYTIVRP
ncbi:DsrE family protein [Roseibium salinum]|uniref:DsrE family protein n=2 Tax=Roseibium salinum TaxID=1604349 RepID=A0ABT3QW80_9HYPH|nr:DsrE family protein [Roseibium sp. DSM 29163]MCX2721130.1 DsrE family protein [Roseibium sp. DSM 29163]MDN3722595.1 DsrE family protein [Roseibium salinum]